MKTLVAGAGNVFLGDDGFGVEVAQRLSTRQLPAGVQIMDVGIRGIHLAHELLDGYEALVLIDAVPTGETPGTVSVIEVDPAADNWEAGSSIADAHGFDPATTLEMVRALGGELPRVYVVGCQPASIEEGMGLSPGVQAAIEPAIEATFDLLKRLAGTEAATKGR